GPGITNQPQIDLIRFDELVHPPGMLILQPNVGLRIVAEEPLHKATHVRQPDRVDRSHADPPRDFLVERANLFFQGEIALDELSAAFVIDLPFRGEHKWPLRPVDQLHTEVLFQSIDDLARSRLRYAVFAGSARKAPAANDIAKNLERFEVHG